MRTGIIIHSNTNNTLSVGERLLETMLCKGTNACLERVTADNEDPNAPQKVRLASAPDTGPYDVLLIGAPVHGFALSRAMDAY